MAETSVATIEKRVKKILIECFAVDEKLINLEAKFQEDLNLDSMDMAGLMAALEEEFKIEIPQQDEAEIKTIQETVNYVKAKVRAG